MYPKKLLFLCGVLSLCTVVQSATSRYDKQHTFAIGGDVGTTGVGGSAWITAGPKITITLGRSSLESTGDYATGGVHYDGNIDFANGYGLIRWYPYGGKFHFSTGAVKSKNSIGVVGSPQNGTTFNINGIDYPTSAIESIVGDVHWDDSVAPYFGLGWSKQARESGWGGYLDLGFIQSGSATAELSATGAIANESIFLDNLRAEEQDLNKELDKFELFPVARLGLMYRF